jgi:hypothetical protein
MVKIFKIFLLVSVCAVFSFSEDIKLDKNRVLSGFSYKKKVFKEKEPNDNFNQALKIIIPVPRIDNIFGVINRNKDIDYFLFYITRPVKVRFIYRRNCGFLPGIVIYNEFKQYMGTKTYSSSLMGSFNSEVIEFTVLKPGFYFFKTGNLSDINGKFFYKIEFVPVDLSLFPELKISKVKKINEKFNNRIQSYLHDIFYKDIIKKFKNFEEYKNFRN